MALLCVVRLLVDRVAFERWRETLGLKRGRQAKIEARQFAADVEWAANRLPFETKCLPRAIALSWLLRRRSIAHAVVFAVRPSNLRDSSDALHSWVEIDGRKILGDLPGPWIETGRFG